MDDLFLQKLLAAGEPEEKAAFIAEALFNRLPAKVALIARQCSLFHWFDQSIVAALLKDIALNEGELRDIYDQVNSLPFVDILPWGSAYNDLTRDGLLRHYIAAQPELLKTAAQLAVPAYKAYGEGVKFMAEVFFCYVIVEETALAEEVLSELVQNAKKRGDWEYIDGLQMLLEEAQAFSFTLPPSYSEILGLSFIPHNTFISSVSDFPSQGRTVQGQQVAPNTLGGQQGIMKAPDLTGSMGDTQFVSQSTPARAEARNIIVIYSHKDRRSLERLRVHLAIIGKLRINIWSDTEITGDMNWRQVTTDALNTAKVVLMLVSASFLTSDSIMNHEIPLIDQYLSQSHFTVLPLILSPCVYEDTPLNRYQPINPNRPLLRLSSSQRDEILVNVVRAILEIFKGFEKEMLEDLEKGTSLEEEEKHIH